MYKSLKDIELAREIISPPGDTLLETIENRNISQLELALHMSRPTKTINEIIKGKAAITEDTAIQLERVLGIDADFWMKRERKYRLELAKINDAETLLNMAEWIKNFPISALKKRGCIPSESKGIEVAHALLSFFSVSNDKAYYECYHNKVNGVDYKMGSQIDKNTYAIACWLRIGEIQSERLNVTKYNAHSFKESMKEVRQLMVSGSKNFFVRLQYICANSGVKLVHTPCLPKVNLYGSTRWIGDCPLIQMSNLYKRNDIFWDTFFHEAGHILEHGKKDVFVLGFDAKDKVIYSKADIKKEREAANFAREYTITEEQERLLFSQYKNVSISNIETNVRYYAHEFNTIPAFVIGRMARRDKSLYRLGFHFNFFEKIDLSL